MSEDEDWWEAMQWALVTAAVLTVLLLAAVGCSVVAQAPETIDAGPHQHRWLDEDGEGLSEEHGDLYLHWSCGSNCVGSQLADGACGICGETRLSRSKHLEEVRPLVEQDAREKARARSAIKREKD